MSKELVSNTNDFGAVISIIENAKARQKTAACAHGKAAAHKIQGLHRQAFDDAGTAAGQRSVS